MLRRVFSTALAAKGLFAMAQAFGDRSVETVLDPTPVPECQVVKLCLCEINLNGKLEGWELIAGMERVAWEDQEPGQRYLRVDDLGVQTYIFEGWKHAKRGGVAITTPFELGPRPAS